MTNGHFLKSLLLSIVLAPLVLFGADNTNPPAGQTPWADWVEPGFPFFSSVLDARQAGGEFPSDNLTPRGLILNLGRDCWACFDTDLLRISAIWNGGAVTPDTLAQKSYHPWGGKTRGGQSPAPEPDGEIWIANGIYPGWQTGEIPNLEDPREPAPSKEEVGRGPLPETMGRFQAVRLVGEEAVLEYTAGGANIREVISASEHNGQSVVERHFEIGPLSQPLLLILGKGTKGRIGLGLSKRAKVASLSQEKDLWIVQVPAHKEVIRFCVSFKENGDAPPRSPRTIPGSEPQTRWPQKVITKIDPSTDKFAYVVDNIHLPLDNPWRRNIRPGDIQFLKDGTGVVPTLDGDVWLVDLQKAPGDQASWSRFASGLHEPMSVAIRDERIFAFDRNGIWQLRDTTGNGEADVHELFSNAFAQTADMREFPSTLRLAPAGEFVIAKGGQQATTLGKHNGSVLRISADGRRSTVLGYGFRQPSIGVNPNTGLVTASDQEGQYIPSTPLHIVQNKQFYGYLSEGLHEREQYPAPIADPLTWIPHSVNASAISQVWLFGANMGALNNGLVLIGFNRPELFKILLNNRDAKPQAAVVSITTGFQYPPLNGSVNPSDGQLYIAGFQINGWGNALDTLAGLGRVRYTGAPATLPSEVTPMDKGVLLRFELPLDPKLATDPDSYSLASWHYLRTYKYGSAQYKAGGEPGIDWLNSSSAYLSKDGRSVFIGVPEMKPVMQLRIGWSLATTAGATFENNAYTTPYTLPKFDPSIEGFGDISVDLTPRTVERDESGPITVEEGRRLHQLMGCAACHSATGTDMDKVGPTWAGLFGSERTVVVNGKVSKVTADRSYLRESLLDPTAKIVRGFDKGEYAMPSYAGVLTDSQIESIVLYIMELNSGATEGPG